jgi:hypothetical protein
MMALSLTSPVGSDFLKDFPGQNAVNCDLIDAYAGPCLTSDALQSYTPALTAATTSPNLGAGSVTGKFYQIWDQIFVWAQFRFGAGFSAGSGTYIMTLPFSVDSTIGPSTTNGASPVLGNGNVWDASTISGRTGVTVALRDINTVHFQIRYGSGSTTKNVDESGPIVWATGDGVTWAARFKRLP